MSLNSGCVPFLGPISDSPLTLSPELVTSVMPPNRGSSSVIQGSLIAGTWYTPEKGFMLCTDQACYSWGISDGDDYIEVYTRK